VLLLGVGANAVLSFQPSGDSFYRDTFPASQGLFKARIQCAFVAPLGCGLYGASFRCLSGGYFYRATVPTCQGLSFQSQHPVRRSILRVLNLLRSIIKLLDECASPLQRRAYDQDVRSIIILSDMKGILASSSNAISTVLNQYGWFCSSVTGCSIVPSDTVRAKPFA
jgi:hypothetical protein